MSLKPNPDALTYWLAEHDDEYGPYGAVLYENSIYTQHNLRTWVYRGAELTLVVVGTHTASNQYLQLFRTKNEIRPGTPAATDARPPSDPVTNPSQETPT